MSAEIWRPVPGWLGYEVSNQGSVRSLKSGTPRKMSLHPHRDGYLMVRLSAGRSHQKTLLVHRLVVAAFIGPRPEGLVIRHLDGDKTNNRLDNLRYGTVEENWQDRFRLGEIRPVVACPYGHLFTKENTYNKDRGRTCRRCHARRNREYRARQRMTAVAS